MNLLDFSIIEIKAFILILFRVSGILFAAPIFGSNLILSRTKLGFSLFLSIILFSMTPYQAQNLPNNLILYVIIIFKEIFLGILFGYISFLIFIGIQFAGQFIGTQMGFGIVNVLDPQTRTQMSIIGQFKFLLAMLVFLSINGHYFILECLFQCFQVIPLGKIIIPGELKEELIKLSSYIFIYSVKLGAPVIISLFITEISLGIIARTVPQMNIFIVGFPLKIGLGLFALAISLPLWAEVFKKLVHEISLYWEQLLTVF